MRSKPTKSYTILSVLEKSAVSALDLMVKLSLTPFTIRYKGVPAALRKRDLEFADAYWRTKDARKESRRLASLLAKLQREGLVVASGSRGALQWSLTKKGVKELSRTQVPKQGKPSKSVVVISYDIPEKLRMHRDWLRRFLSAVGLQLVHKSLWIGKIEIPEELFIELKEREIGQCVQIFSIDKEGTLEHVSP